MNISTVYNFLFWSLLFLPFVVMFFFVYKCYLGKYKRSPFFVLPLTVFVSAVVFYAFPLFYTIRDSMGAGERSLGAAAIVLSFTFAFVVLIVLSLISAFIARRYGRKNL